MNNTQNLERAYAIGSELAIADYQEKVAFLGAIGSAGKFLLGMGHLGAKGSTAARLSAHHVGMPLGFGLLGAATAEEGKGMEGMTQKGGHKRSTESGAGLTQKGVEKYRRQNPGSKLQTAVTTPPSKLKPGSKAAKRRKSFCARSRGWTGERGKAARRRWNC